MGQTQKLNGGSKNTVPMTCIEPSCQQHKVQYFHGESMCKTCGNELFPVQELVLSESVLDDDVIFSDDMLERIGANAFIDMSTSTQRGNGYNHNYQPRVIKDNDTFRCPDDLTTCPVAPTPKVQIPMEMFNQWIFLAGQLTTEWIALLDGVLVEGEENTYEITKMYFPKQKATGAHVEAEDGEESRLLQENNIPGTAFVAAVHSHVGMSVFFSGEDHAHFNHTIELVINNKAEIKAVGRVKLECGRFHRSEADIEFTACANEIALQEELESKLTEQKGYYYTTAKGGSQQEPVKKEQKELPMQAALPIA